MNASNTTATHHPVEIGAADAFAAAVATIAAAFAGAAFWVAFSAAQPPAATPDWSEIDGAPALSLAA